MGGKDQRRHSISTRHRDFSSTASAGCMGGMLHYFDFHHFNINLFNAAAHATDFSNSNSLTTSPSPPSDRSGLEAPRNSLDLDLQGQQLPVTDQPNNTSSSSSSLLQEDHYFDIPLVGVGVQFAPANFDIFPPNIKRHTRKLSLSGDQQDHRRVPLSDTPETPRTPSLVARLMGIDGLPDAAPSPPATAPQKKLTSKNIELKKKKRELPSSSKLQEEMSKKEPRQPLRNISINCNARLISDVGCRSLPDTPRVSSAQSSWDVDARHSLQIHHENLNSSNCNVNVNVPVGGDYSLPPSPTHYSMKLKPRRKYQYHDENRSPRSREYAKEIVKQMKETISNRRSESGRQHTNVRSRRSVREVEKHDINGSSRTKPVLGSVLLSPPSPDQPVSAPLTLSLSKTTTKAKLQDHIPNLHVLPKPVRVRPSRPPPPPPVPLAVAVAAGGTGNGKCTKGANERFTARLKKPSSTSTSGSGCLAIGTVSVTGDKSFSTAIEKSEIPLKLLIRSPEPQYLKKDESTCSAVQPKIGKSCRTRPEQDLQLEYKYVRSILHQGGFMGGSCHAAAKAKTKRYSAWHPMDPIVFHQLEVELPVDDTRYRGSGLRYRWNRKHLFDLVEEVLRELLELDCPYNDAQVVVGKVWTEIERMIGLSRECEYLTDIDALVGVDIAVRKIRELTQHKAVRKEGREIGVEMEEEIVEELIGETAAVLMELYEYDQSRMRVRSDDVSMSGKGISTETAGGAGRGAQFHAC